MKNNSINANKSLFEAVRKSGFADVKINELAVTYNPRFIFEDSKIEELANSIKENGLLQPIEIFIRDGKPILLGGERRTRAIKLLKSRDEWKSDTIPCLIKTVKNKVDQIVKSFISNNGVKLTPAETSDVITLLEQEGLSTKDIAKRLCKHESQIREYKSINKVIEVKNAMKTGDITKQDASLISRQINNGRHTTSVNDLIELAKKKKQTNIENRSKPKPKIKIELTLQEELQISIDILEAKGLHKVVALLNLKSM